MDAGILTLDDFDFRDKTVILRLDINSPIDHRTGQLADDNRIRKSVPTILELSDAGARVVMLAHQGDTEDYRSLVSLVPHAERFTELVGRLVAFVDDIAGPTATERIKTLQSGELLLLNNVRYLTEEVSTFVNFVKLTPSLIGFAEVLPAAGGRLFVDELSALTQVKEDPARPCVYVLGGARIADAFSMMKRILDEGTADHVLTSGLTGEVMLLAQGYQLGRPTERLIHNKGLSSFIDRARELLEHHRDRILYPTDLAVDDGGRKEIALDDLPVGRLLVDIGEQTVRRYTEVIRQAATIFVNGPAGVYEQPVSALGTERLWTTIAEAPGYSVIGGGDSVAAAARFGVRDRMGYVCTSGGGMVRFLSGQALPVVEALRRATRRYQGAGAE